MYKLIKYLSLIVCFSFSCTNPMDIEKNIKKTPTDNTVDSSKFNVIKPLWIGNNWAYRIKTFDSSGAQLSDNSIINSIDKDTLMENLRWYSSDISGVEWESNQSDGLHFRNNHRNNTIIDWVEAKYPGDLGYSWQCDSTLRKISSKDTSITVSAGTFKCYFFYDIYYSPVGCWIYKNIFYAPKIGLVKKEYFKQFDGGKKFMYQIDELVTYKVIFG